MSAGPSGPLSIPAPLILRPQGLIDENPFVADDDNLFGDLIEAKKNELNHGYGLHHTNPAQQQNNGGHPGASATATSSSRQSPTASLGSSGHSSPGATSSDSSAGFGYRPPAHLGASTLAYLPGSVHSGAGASGAANTNNGGFAQVGSGIAG